MAIRDVKEYYIKTLQQYIESKADLADFEQAVKDGYITEDRLEDVKTELELIKENVDRLGYIIFLLNLPKRKSKQPAYIKANQEIIARFKAANCDQEAVYTENDNLMTLIREQLTELTK